MSERLFRHRKSDEAELLHRPTEVAFCAPALFRYILTHNRLKNTHSDSRGWTTFNQQRPPPTQGGLWAPPDGGGRGWTWSDELMYAFYTVSIGKNTWGNVSFFKNFYRSEYHHQRPLGHLTKHLRQTVKVRAVDFDDLVSVFIVTPALFPLWGPRQDLTTCLTLSHSDIIFVQRGTDWDPAHMQRNKRGLEPEQWSDRHRTLVSSLYYVLQGKVLIVLVGLGRRLFFVLLCDHWFIFLFKISDISMRCFSKYDLFMTCFHQFS